MVYNSPLANSILTFCQNVNVPEIIQSVEGEQGVAGPARTTGVVARHGNFLKTFCKAFETLNPGSIAKIYTTEVNDEERFDGFCLCFRPQILRIVREDICVFTLDVFFIKHEQNNLKGCHFTPCVPCIQTPT
jgi:hypothetical protein